MESIYENPRTSKQRILDEHKTESVVERVEYKDGIKIYLKGAQFPQKSCPTPEAIIAINTIKRVMISFMKSALIPLSVDRLLKTFNRICLDVINQHIMKEVYMTSFTKEMLFFIFTFLKAYKTDEETARTTSKIISHVFEYDTAYRYRLQDIINETDKNRLKSSKEIRRLANLLFERDDVMSIQYGGDRRVGKQFKRAALLISILYLLPKFRKALKKALSVSNFNNFKMDDSDKYWAYLRTDYNFGGLTYEQRMIEYNKLGFKLPNNI